MNWFAFLPLLAIFALTTQAQIIVPNSTLNKNDKSKLELPSNFEYKRETGQETGIPYYHLMPSAESITYDALKVSTWEALGLLVQPERDKYALSLINYKQKYQLHLQKNKGVTLEIDAEKFDIKTYTLGKREVLGKLKFESAVILIDKNIYEKLVKADDVTIRVGIVRYNLDQDNIDAIRYFADEVERDMARRAKTKLPTKIKIN